MLAHCHMMFSKFTRSMVVGSLAVASWRLLTPAEEEGEGEEEANTRRDAAGLLGVVFRRGREGGWEMEEEESNIL